MAAARLKAGVTARQAEAAMNGLDAELAGQYPDSQRRQPDPLTVLRRSGLSGSPVWGVFIAMATLLMIVVGIVFLIACANVAGLLIARALTRRREILIRLSLGASRPRLIRQFLTESLLLGLLGAAAGLAMAFAAGDALTGLLPQSISGGFRFQHGIDGHVLVFTLALSVASVLLSGLLPALRASDQNLSAAGRTQTAGGHAPRLRRWLIVAQVAASVLVLATAGIFVRTFQKARKTDPGFDAAHLLTADLDLRGMKFPRARAGEFYSQLRSRLGDLPGVLSVSLADVLPLGNTRVVTIPDEGDVATAVVDSNYFRTMGIRLLRGREPQSDERNVVIVNEALARRLWPDQDPTGKSIRLEGQPLQRVIGLTATGRYWSLAEPARPFVYRISGQLADPIACLAIRIEGPPRSLAARVTQEIQESSRDLPAITVQTAQERLGAWLEPQQAAAVLLSILGLAALGLAITGLYALLAQMVIQRAPEIAVRMTLGATRVAVVGMLLRQSALLVFTGTATGIAASAAVSRLLASLSGAVSPLDGITLIGVAALIAAVGAAATLVPAYRAASVDPVSALRVE
jgi:predicted permease